MNKIKRLTLQSILIAILLFSFYYFGGYYISQEECIRDTLRGLYATETDIIMELGNKKYSLTLVADKDAQTYSIVGTKKIGFLYHTASSYTSRQIDPTKSLDILGFYEKEMGSILYLYRNDISITKVEVTLSDGTTFLLEKWHDNFTGYHLNSDQWRLHTYKAYDSSGQLIYETVY